MNRRALLAAPALLLPGRARAQLIVPGIQSLAARDGLRNPPPFAFNLMGGALPAGATFQRASVGWAFGSTGVLTPYANDVPRFSYTSAGQLRVDVLDAILILGEGLGLLLGEEAIVVRRQFRQSGHGVEVRVALLG